MRLFAWFGAVALSLAAGSAHAQTVTLKVSHFLPAVSNFQRGVLEPWCDRINKGSQNRLKCQIYPSMQLGGTPAQLVDQVKNGVADIVWTAPGYSAGRFPIIETLEVPFSVPAGGLSGSRTMWEFYEKYAQKDFEAYKVLAVFSGGGQVFSTANRPMLSVSDFKNEKLRIATRISANMLKEFGGTPVNVPASQIAESISKGVVDGAMAPWELVPAAKVDEVTKFHTETQPGQLALTLNSLVILMSQEKYDSLSPELKAVIDKESGISLVEAAGKAWDVAIDQARKKVLGEKHSLQEISDNNYAEMRKAAAPIEAEWTKNYKGSGSNGADLVAGLRAISSKYIK